MDWEIYRDRLLSPEDFQKAAVVPDEYVFIGQYGGFEGRSSDRSPHGSATYRLNIVLPNEYQNYMLELPEIYSAYKLYINGRLAAEMGDPERESYPAETGNAKFMLNCAGQLEIILAVADYSHFYSGLVYPPAFGKSDAVETLLNTRLVIRSAAVALAAAVGLFYLCIWLLLKKEKSRPPAQKILRLLYAALCLCFALYVCYPVFKTLHTSGISWYTLEKLSFNAMLLFTVLIQSRITGFPERLTKIFTAAGIFICALAFIVPQVMGDSLDLMMAYSFLLTAYSWITALFLLVSAAYGVYNNSVYSRILFAGSVVFAVSLVMHRGLPLFEPILFGWFSEISSAIFVLFIGVAMAEEVAKQFRLRLQLEGRIESITRIMKVQKTYYPVILDKEEELRAARHDFRHHMATIRELIDGAQHSKLSEYMEAFDEKYTATSSKSYCKHYVADMLIRMYAGLAGKQNTEFYVQAALPEMIPVSDADLCVIISNLLENALEASAKIPDEERRIRFRVRCTPNHLAISVENIFDGAVDTQGSRLLSSKQSGREGIGLASVRSVCGIYNGSADFYVQGKVFHSKVLLPLTGDERREPK
jgi:hypothetical protein